MSDLRNPLLARLLDLWRERAASGPLPLSESFTPEDLAPWYGNLVVMDVAPGSEFVYAFYDRGFAKTFDVNMAGRSIDRLPAAQRDVLQTEYQEVVRTRAPRWRLYTADFGGGEMQSWERLVLPLSTGDDRVTKLLVSAYRLDQAEDGSGAVTG